MSWHFRTVGTNPCLATGFLSLRQSSSRMIFIAVSQKLFFASQGSCCSLHCTGPLQTLSNCTSQQQVTWSRFPNGSVVHPSYFVQLLFSIQRSGSYIGKIRDGKNKVSAQLPTQGLLYHFLIAIPFLLLADRSSVQFHNLTEHLNMFVFSFSEKSLMEKLPSDHRVITKWKRLCQSAVTPSSAPKELFLGNNINAELRWQLSSIPASCLPECYLSQGLAGLASK